VIAGWQKSTGLQVILEFKEMMEKLSDSELVIEFQKGDHDLRNQVLMIFYDRYKYLIIKLCYSFLKDLEQSKDVLHNVFIKVAEKLGELQNPEVFRPWIIMITKNSSVDFLRRASKFSGGKHVPLEVEPYSSVREEDMAIAGIEKQKILTILKDCMKKLSRFDLNIFSLRCDGLRAKEICDLLKLERNALRQSYERIKKILETCMKRKRFRLSIDQIVAVGELDES
jgi:RNA polymerase sigma-70 factor (ECF subfamily)